MPPQPSAPLFASCPAPLSQKTTVTLAHGGGGRLTQELIDGIFRPAFANEALEQQHDGAVLAPTTGRLAFTTDAHVVSPLFFPGGDIGSLAINGTVNDLVMCGARPLALSAAFVIEEGLALSVLERVALSMREAALLAGVRVVTGDTKVVERGKGDGLYIVTSGVGVVEHGLSVGPSSVAEGDAILLSGDVGRHGMAIMSAREGLSFESPIESDCACLSRSVQALLEAGLKPHCLRDLTRGGLATSLVEIAEASKTGLWLDEAKVPVTEAVHGACEILGLDPLYVANEGRFVCFLPESQADRALEVLSATAPGGPAVRIGHVASRGQGRVVLRSVVGADRLLTRLSGEQLPRIC